MRRRALSISISLLVLCIIYIAVYHLYLTEWMKQSYITVVPMRVYSVSWIIGSVSFGFAFSNFVVKEYSLLKNRFLFSLAVGVLIYSLAITIFYFNSTIAFVLSKNVRSLSIFFFLTGIIFDCYLKR